MFSGEAFAVLVYPSYSVIFLVKACQSRLHSSPGNHR